MDTVTSVAEIEPLLIWYGQALESVFDFVKAGNEAKVNETANAKGERPDTAENPAG